MENIQFTSRLAAIDWIAENATSEAQFEVLREQLTFNFIYTGRYYLELRNGSIEVVLLGKNKKEG